MTFSLYIIALCERSKLLFKCLEDGNYVCIVYLHVSQLWGWNTIWPCFNVEWCGVCWGDIKGSNKLYFRIHHHLKHEQSMELMASSPLEIKQHYMHSSMWDVFHMWTPRLTFTNKNIYCRLLLWGFRGRRRCCLLWNSTNDDWVVTVCDLVDSVCAIMPHGWIGAHAVNLFSLSQTRYACCKDITGIHKTSFSHQGA